MATVDLAGISLDFWEGGEGPPLLFLHGAGGFRADHAFLGLLGKQRRIVAPSHPGFGLSSLPDWIDRPEDIAHVYLDILDRVSTGPIDLIACSLGGWIGADFCCASAYRGSLAANGKGPDQGFRVCRNK